MRRVTSPDQGGALAGRQHGPNKVGTESSVFWDTDTRWSPAPSQCKLPREAIANGLQAPFSPRRPEHHAGPLTTLFSAQPLAEPALPPGSLQRANISKHGATQLGGTGPISTHRRERANDTRVAPRRRAGPWPGPSAGLSGPTGSSDGGLCPIRRPEDVPREK